MKIKDRDVYTADLREKQAMASGIFAVANIGNVRLYVGEVKHLKTRWPQMMAQLEQGTFEDAFVQQAWRAADGERRFSFNTAKDIHRDSALRGRAQFLCDYEQYTPQANNR